MPCPRASARLAIALFCVAAVLDGCKAEPARTYPIRGQILAMAAGARADGRRDVTVKHEDIPAFMPAMTMVYMVKEPALLDNFAPGDLVTADLVVHGSDIYLTRLKKTAHADVPPEARSVKVMDVMSPGDEVPDDPLREQPSRR